MMKAKRDAAGVDRDLQPAELADIHERIRIAAVDVPTHERVDEIGERIGGPQPAARST